MKRIGYLYNDIISIENLKLADIKARKGKRHTYGVIQHDKNREANILALHEALKNKTWQPSKYDVFTIHEPKERKIYRLPYYPDRIVHHAIMNILEPIWVQVFTYNTYSCIKGRGIEGCARRVERIIKNFRGNRLYCLKIDICKYYPSVDNEIVKSLVRRKIKDKDLLWLLDTIIDSTKGLPIGNYISQYLANLYLSYFMHWVNEELPIIVKDRLNLSSKPIIKATEYADDIVFFASNKAVLWEVFDLVGEYIADNLKLEIRGNYQLFPVTLNRQDKHGRALDYVGYKFYRKTKLIRKGIKKNFCRAVIKLNRKNISVKEYKQIIAPWLGWAKHSNSRHLLKTITNPYIYENLF